MDLTKIIKEGRKRNHITQSALAKSLGVTRNAVSSWEKGTRIPRTEILRELLIILDVPAKDLETKTYVHVDDRLAGFKLSRLNAAGLKKLYDFYYDLIKDESNLRR